MVEITSKFKHNIYRHPAAILIFTAHNTNVYTISNDMEEAEVKEFGVKSNVGEAAIIGRWSLKAWRMKARKYVI